MDPEVIVTWDLLGVLTETRGWLDKTDPDSQSLVVRYRESGSGYDSIRIAGKAVRDIRLA